MTTSLVFCYIRNTNVIFFTFQHIFVVLYRLLSNLRIKKMVSNGTLSTMVTTIRVDENISKKVRKMWKKIFILVVLGYTSLSTKYFLESYVYATTDEESVVVNEDSLS